MGISLHSLLECSHFLDSHELSPPLGISQLSLLPLNLQLFHQLRLLLLQVVNFCLHLFYLLIVLWISRNSLPILQSIDRLQQAMRILDFVLDQWPQLLEKRTQILRFLLRFF